jgi:hypothetical protein
VRDVGGVPRPCVTVTAPAGLGAAIVIEFPAGRIGRTLYGHAGPAGTERGGPVHVAVVLDGEEIGSAEVPVEAWIPFRVDMTRVAGAVKPISLVITSPGPLGVCLDAMVLP